MAVQFRCPHCGRETIVDDQYVGQAGPCAGCGQTIIVSSGQESAGDDAAIRMMVPVGRPISAIAAGYLGLLSLAILPLGPIAIICSIIAYRTIKSDPHQHGMGRVLTGFILGGIGTLLLVLVIISLVAASSSPPPRFS